MDVIEKGKLAEDLTHNLLWNNIIPELEKKIIAEWMNTAKDDRERRETLYHKMTALREIRQEVQGCINNAKYELKQKETKNGR